MNQGKPPIAATPKPGDFKGGEYLPGKLALRTELPNEQRLEMKPVQPTLTRAKFSRTNTQRRTPATLKRTRNINSSKTS